MATNPEDELRKERARNVQRGHPWNADKLRALREILEKKRIAHNNSKKKPKPDKRRWTQERISSYLEVNPEVYQLWETGYIVPSAHYQDVISTFANKAMVKLYLENNDLMRLRQEIICLLDVVYQAHIIQPDPDESAEKKKLREEAISIYYEKCLMALQDVDWYRYGVKVEHTPP